MLLFFLRLEWIYHLFVSHIKKRVGLVYIEEKCPSNESYKCFEVLSKIAEDMKILRNEMKYEKGINIVLILSFALDAMIRAVLMFPRVFL